MPKNKKQKKKIRLSESYISLIIGFFVVLVVSILLIIFAKNRTYDRINTAISTFQEPSQETTQTKEEDKTYEVKIGDTLWSIAEKTYGSGYNWVDLVKANKLENPEVILAGTKLKLPEVQKIVVAKVEVQNPVQSSIASASYKVQSGDYLWNIAIRKYGDGYKWPEIARANSIPNPDLIYANTVLKLP